MLGFGACHMQAYFSLVVLSCVEARLCRRVYGGARMHNCSCTDRASFVLRSLYHCAAHVAQYPCISRLHRHDVRIQLLMGDTAAAGRSSELCRLVCVCVDAPPLAKQALSGVCVCNACSGVYAFRIRHPSLELVALLHNLTFRL